MRPVIVLQKDSLNRTGIATLLCVPLTTNMRWARAAGNVVLEGSITGLPRDSVANVSQLFPVNRTDFIELVGQIPHTKLNLIFSGVDIILGR